jgi:uncharacterized protein YlxW (UPF0749 family)
MTTTLLPTTSTTSTTTTSTSPEVTTTPSPCGTNLCTPECQAYLRNKIYNYQEENKKLNKKIEETNNALKPKNDYVTILKTKYYNYKSKNPPTTMLVEKVNTLIMISIDRKLNFLKENEKTLSVTGKNFYEQQIQFDINCMLLSVAEVEYNNFLWAAPASNKNSLAAYEKEIEKLENDRNSFNDTLNLNNDEINAYENIIANCQGKKQANANCSFNDKACFSSETDYHDAVVNAAIGCFRNITRVNPDLQSF